MASNKPASSWSSSRLYFGLWSVYSFWLFSFERLNGVLGSYHTNCHNISLQLMRRFTSSSFYNVNNWPVEYKDQFYPLLSKFITKRVHYKLYT